MTKERADKLVAAGIVGEKNTVVVNNQKTWDENLEAYLEFKGKKDPENTEPKPDRLPAPLRIWWNNQRRNCKVHLDGGKVDIGRMTKERADKLVAGGIDEPMRNFGCQVPKSSYHRITSPPGHPGHPHHAPYSHPVVAGGASQAPGQGADGDDNPSQNSSSGLPPGWIPCYDSISGRPHCVQETTGQTTWNRPSGLGATPSKSESPNPQQPQPCSHFCPPAHCHSHCYPPNPCYGHGGVGCWQPQRASSGGGPGGGPGGQAQQRQNPHMD